MAALCSAQVNGGSRNFYTWWTLSVNREVTTWIFSWSSLNYSVGQKVTKFGIFSHPARKLSALTPELNFQQKPYTTSRQTFNPLPHYLAKVISSHFANLKENANENVTCFDF